MDWDKPTNEHDRSAKMYFRAPPETERAIRSIVELRRFPYKSASHLIRHALWKHLKWLETKEATAEIHTLDTPTPPPS